MKRNIQFGLMALLCLTGCGSGTEPLAMLGDSSQSLGEALGPGLILPLIASGSYGAQGFLPYSAATPYLSIQNNTFNVTTQVVAPGNGVVVDISSQSVTIFHNAHVISKVMGVMNTVQVGAYVTQGATIGTGLQTNAYAGSPVIKFYVFADGIPVCPLSYLNQQGRTELKSAIVFVYGVNASDPCT